MGKQQKRTYEDVCRELADQGIDAYRATILTDLDSVELGRYYRLFFEFGQEFLDKEALPFNIRPARMYFNTIPKAVNACARYLPDSGYHLIEVNRGCIKTLFRHFYFENRLFDDPALTPFRDVARSAEQEPGFIVFQMTCLYLLYHEIGHLVQNSLEHGPVYEENPQSMPDRGSTRDRHIREMDADYFSGYHVAIHIKAFAEALEKMIGRLTTDRFENCAALALSAIYMFHILVSYHARGI